MVERESILEVQQLYNGVPDEMSPFPSGPDSTTVPGSVIMWVFDENGNKLAEQTLPNGPGAYSFSLFGDILTM